MAKRKKLLWAVNKLETAIGMFWFTARRKLNRIDTLIIMPYRGYGNRQEVHVGGRVLEDAGLEKPSAEDSTFTNLVAMLRRYRSKEIPFIRLSVTFQGKTQELTTDDEGYFKATLPVDATRLPPDQLWHTVHFELLDSIVPGQGKVTATGEVLIPDEQSDFGIISDIDDTVLISDTTSLLKMLRLSLTENAATRMPFHGVGAFYEALQQGKEGQSHNPFFYVSSSPWNLYDLLVDFFERNHLPKGPIWLRDIGISETKFIKEKHSKHKPVKIRHILATYPDLPFVLIGDSGQRDPEIYQQMIEEFPGRILAAYIRDISLRGKGAEQRIQTLIGDSKVPMILCETMEAVSRHALTLGLIQPQKLEDIHQDTEKDAQAEETGETLKPS